MKPIESNAEREVVFNYLVNTTMSVKKVGREQAEKRVNALLESGILENGSPENLLTRMKIDEFMSREI
jgi:hypothetical protein